MGNSEKAMYILMAALVACGVGYLLYVELYPFPADFDAHNLTSATNNAFTMIGCLSGMLVVYFGEKKWVNFSTEGAWWIQIIKVSLGLGLVLAMKVGLKAPLNMLLGELAGRAVRYFLMVVAAGLIWPMTFRLWNKLDNKEKN